MTCTDRRIKTSMPWKHIGSWLQRHGDQWTQKRTQGIPLRGLQENCTCEAGGSEWRGTAGNWLPLGSLRASMLAPPHAAVPDNITTEGILRWRNPLGGPGYPGRLSSHQNYIFSFIFLVLITVRKINDLIDHFSLQNWHWRRVGYPHATDDIFNLYHDHENADKGTRWRKCTCWASLSSLKTSEWRHTCVSVLFCLKHRT